MRIALISDIHGNVISLDAVLAALENESIDEIVCLGDVATLGPQPRQVVDRLQALDCQLIMGNHETDVLDIAGMEQRQTQPQIVMESIKWCAQQLSDEQLDFLRTFHSKLDLQLDASTSLLCFHGSPQSNTDIILATTPADELDGLFAGTEATVLAGGHTHIPLLRRHHDRLIVNPGSVGEPLSQMPVSGGPGILPWAEYAVVSAERGAVRVDLRRVPVDVDAIEQACLNSTNPVNLADYWIWPAQL